MINRIIRILGATVVGKEQGRLPSPELSLEKGFEVVQSGMYKEKVKHSSFAMSISKAHTLVVKSLKYIFPTKALPQWWLGSQASPQKPPM